MKCIYCATENPPGAKFCGICGKPINSQLKILQRGEPVRPEPSKPAAIPTKTRKKKVSKPAIGAIVLAVFAIAAVVFLIVSNKIQVQEAIDSAKDKWDQGDHRKAVQILADARNKHSSEQIDELYQEYSNQYVKEVIQRADSYALGWNYNYAIRDLKQALELLPNDYRLKQSLNEYDWTAVLCSNSEYQVVRKDINTYNSYTIYVGVLDGNGDWVRPLSASNNLAQFIVKETGKTSLNGGKTSVNSGNFYYLGDGVVVGSLGVTVLDSNMNRVSVGTYSGIGGNGLACYYYNIKEDCGFVQDAVTVSTVLTAGMNSYIVYYDYGAFTTGWYRITTTGEDLRSFPAIRGPYSDGLFLGTPDSNWHDDEFYFYDITGKAIIDLTSYDIQNEKTTKFENGVCEICFKNPSGQIYYATIDKKGAFVVSPHQ